MFAWLPPLMLTATRIDWWKASIAWWEAMEGQDGGGVGLITIWASGNFFFITNVSSTFFLFVCLRLLLIDHYFFIYPFVFFSQNLKNINHHHVYRKSNSVSSVCPSGITPPPPSITSHHVTMKCDLSQHKQRCLQHIHSCRRFKTNDTNCFITVSVSAPSPQTSRPKPPRVQLTFTSSSATTGSFSSPTQKTTRPSAPPSWAPSLSSSQSSPSVVSSWLVSLQTRSRAMVDGSKILMRSLEVNWASQSLETRRERSPMLMICECIFQFWQVGFALVEEVVIWSLKSCVWCVCFEATV